MTPPRTLNAPVGLKFSHFKTTRQPSIGQAPLARIDGVTGRYGEIERRALSTSARFGIGQSMGHITWKLDAGATCDSQPSEHRTTLLISITWSSVNRSKTECQPWVATRLVRRMAQVRSKPAVAKVAQSNIDNGSGTVSTVTPDVDEDEDEELEEDEEEEV